MPAQRRNALTLQARVDELERQIVQHEDLRERLVAVEEEQRAARQDAQERVPVNAQAAAVRISLRKRFVLRSTEGYELLVRLEPNAARPATLDVVRAVAPDLLVDLPVAQHDALADAVRQKVRNLRKSMKRAMGRFVEQDQAEIAAEQQEAWVEERRHEGAQYATRLHDRVFAGTLAKVTDQDKARGRALAASNLDELLTVELAADEDANAPA